MSEVKPDAGNVGRPSTFSGVGGSDTLHEEYFKLLGLVASREFVYNVWYWL